MKLLEGVDSNRANPVCKTCSINCVSFSCYIFRAFHSLNENDPPLQLCLQSVGKMLSMGYGFVQYQKAEAAQKALRQLQVRLLKLLPLLHPAESSRAEPSSQLICVICLNPLPALLCGRSPVRAEDF